MLLNIFVFMINFEIFSGAFIGDEVPILTKTPKIIRYVWTTPLSIRSATASDFHGYLQYHYDDDTTKRTRLPPIDGLEFEPVINHINHQFVSSPGINCDEFGHYAMNCTLESAVIYNSSRKSPPMPAKMYDWCTAIRHLTNCAIDWNSECKDVTENHFNEESIKGHMHVVNHICDDDWFLSHYDDLPGCIDKVARGWEKCYITFKSVVDAEKNTTLEWTHFLTHFYLCCARTQFRHCTLNALFLDGKSKCQHEHAVILQKFSVIVSEGDVYQNCDKYMQFSSCPGGDPRPSTDLLLKLMNSETAERMKLVANSSLSNAFSVVLIILICLIKLC